MRWRALRPVGEQLGPIRADIRPDGVLPAGFQAFFVQSGTAALALALLTTKAHALPSRTRVILPAYGCPDLVAATVYAGLEPHLVDTAQDSPFYDHEELARELDDRVLAVVCAHFLGFREQVAEVAAIANSAGITVIEDSAQAIPPLDGSGLADLVTMSFGRGKPAGALGGGCLLARGVWADRVHHRHIGTAEKSRMPLHLKRILFNLAISPPVYGPLARSGAFGIGETRYRPLPAINALNHYSTQAALNQVQLARSFGTPNTARIESFLRAISQASNMAPAPWIEKGIGCGLITRLPLVAPTKRLRDHLHERLQALGLGSSVMYGQWLPEVAGVPTLAMPATDRAKSLAERLLTLPVHSGVGQHHFDRIISTVTPMSTGTEIR